jgi:hypothetical protein
MVNFGKIKDRLTSMRVFTKILIKLQIAFIYSTTFLDVNAFGAQ